MIIATLFTLRLKAETVALSDDPDFIRASLIITGPGRLPYQITGHAAIRMECPKHNLDRVFSFHNNGSNIFKKVFITGVDGWFQEFEFNEYMKEFNSEDRETKCYYLNLTLNEKARLWEVLDSLKTLPPRPFRLLDAHCFSEISRAIEIAVRPSRIMWDYPALQQNTYNVNARLSGGDNNLWNHFIINLTLGNIADESNNARFFVYPTTFEMSANSFPIVSPDGQRRPLVVGEPAIVSQSGGNDRGIRPSPNEAAFLLLAVVILITVFQLFGKWKLAGTILDIVLWILVTIGGLIILFITYAPIHYGGRWNWPLIVLNPFAWIPLVIFRKNKAFLRIVWKVYAVVLVSFACFINFIAPSMGVFWPVVALAIALRCALRISKTSHSLQSHNRLFAKKVKTVNWGNDNIFKMSKLTIFAHSFNNSFEK